MNKRKTIGIIILSGLILLVIFAIQFPSVYYPQYKRNQTQAVSKVIDIALKQISAYKNNNAFETPDEAKINEMQSNGYKIEMTADQKSFQIWATPIEYGKTGEISYYVDNKDGNIRGADHKGGKANETDLVIQKIPDDLKETLRQSQSQK